MTRIIMHGCNGKMGQVISGLLAGDAEAELVAGVDALMAIIPIPYLKISEIVTWRQIVSLIFPQPQQ